MSSQLIPVVTSQAGVCLSALNWQEVGVQSLSYGLDSLLMKPGLAVLEELSDLKKYLACPGKLILNASQFKVLQRGNFVLKSIYDGSRIIISCTQLLELIHRLQPDIVLLPPYFSQDLPECWQSWPEEVFPFILAEELAQQNLTFPHGVYFDVSSSLRLQALDSWQIPRYVLGQLTLSQIRELVALGVEWIETNEPADLGFQGIVINSEGLLSIKDVGAQMQFELIEKNCLCPTCTQWFTRAYLHHLYWHTPLLCQRYLIQHNLMFAGKVLVS